MSFGNPFNAADTSGFFQRRPVITNENVARSFAPARIDPSHNDYQLAVYNNVNQSLYHGGGDSFLSDRSRPFGSALPALDTTIQMAAADDDSTLENTTTQAAEGDAATTRTGSSGGLIPEETEVPEDQPSFQEFMRNTLFGSNALEFYDKYVRSDEKPVEVHPISDYNFASY